jgi:hypothetical protein
MHGCVVFFINHGINTYSAIDFFAYRMCDNPCPIHYWDMQVDGLNLTFARLPFPDEYFDLWSPTDQISGREAALLDTDVLIFQFGQWPAGSLMLNKGM